MTTLERIVTAGWKVEITADFGDYIVAAYLETLHFAGYNSNSLEDAVKDLVEQMEEEGLL